MEKSKTIGILAERKYYLKGQIGGEPELTVLLWQPFQLEGQYYQCAFEIRSKTQLRVEHADGVDPVDSIETALRLIGTILREQNYTKYDGQLCWEGGEGSELGFPTIEDSWRLRTRHSGLVDDGHATRTRDSLQRLRTLSVVELCAIASSAEQGEEERAAAIYVLARRKKTNTGVVTKPLLEAFWAKSKALPYAAAFALGQMEGKQATPGLLRVIKKAPSLTSRRAAIYALGWLADPRAIPTLVGVLHNSREEAHVRGAAAEALGFCGHRRQDALAALIQGLRDKEPVVRFMAAFALGLCGDRSAIAPLQELFSDVISIPGYGIVGDEACYAIRLIRARSK